MSEIYIEFLLKSKYRLKEFLLEKLDQKMNENGFYKSYKQFGGVIVEKAARGNQNYNVFDFHFSYDPVKKWKITLRTESKDVPIRSFLQLLNKDYDMVDWIREIEEVFYALKQVIKENSRHSIIDSEEVETFFRRYHFVSKLKTKFEQHSNQYVSWGLTIPSIPLFFIIPEFGEEHVSDHLGFVILPPVPSGLVINDELVAAYIEQHKLVEIINKHSIQSIFEGEKKQSIGEMLSDELSQHKSELSNILLSSNNFSDLAASFKNANPNVELYSIIYNSIQDRLPKSMFKSAKEVSDFPGYTDVIKTEEGFYYLMDDNKTLGFQTLNDTYNV